jgi:hypothetical protein
VSPSEPQAHIVWRTTPPTPAQLAAWRQLWARLLGPVERDPETPQPQELNPGAVDCATVSSGHTLLKEQNNDSTRCAFRT